MRGSASDSRLLGISAQEPRRSAAVDWRTSLIGTSSWVSAPRIERAARKRPASATPWQSSAMTSAVFRGHGYYGELGIVLSIVGCRAVAKVGRNVSARRHPPSEERRLRGMAVGRVADPRRGVGLYKLLRPRSLPACEWALRGPCARRSLSGFTGGATGRPAAESPSRSLRMRACCWSRACATSRRHRHQ